MNSGEMIEHMKARGFKQETIDMIHYCGVDFAILRNLCAALCMPLSIIR